jgi:hypothetical protein
VLLGAAEGAATIDLLSSLVVWDTAPVTAESEEAPAVAVQKSSGITDAERYLEALCERNFLSLWSYPRPFRDQAGNKEICDLLVVMGDDVVIFSDKHCVLEPKKSLEVDWGRWFRSAVQAGAKQAWGAERWLREHPDRVFLDPACLTRLPVDVPPPDRARYHLVVTVHGVSAACQAMLGGSGSLVLRTDLQGLAAHTEPFAVGDLDPDRAFVHVFDDATLDFMMSTLDTTADLLRYLRAKEAFCRSRMVYVAGEENLLAHYLMNIGGDGHHALVFDPDLDVIAIDDSWWDSFESSPERRAQIDHDRVSYVWDRLIEQFAKHALGGTQFYATAPALQSAETVLRFMAAETRFRRRLLGTALTDALDSTRKDERRIRLIPRQLADEPMYVFVLLPWFGDKPEEENREVRRAFLQACIYVAKMKNPDAMDVIGIATESGFDHQRRSEDALYLDARTWSAEDEALALSYQADLGILVSEQATSFHFKEYPVSDPLPRNPRNKPCPCGSGLKYKRCHGS